MDRARQRVCVQKASTKKRDFHSHREKFVRFYRRYGEEGEEAHDMATERQ